MKIVADDQAYKSTSSALKAGNIKQFQEPVQQTTNAGFELLSINAQMVMQQARMDTAQKEIANQQAVIANANDTLESLSSRYTKDDLYAFLERSVRSLFYQTYILACDFAKKAEAAFIFERGPQSSPCIQFGYWDPSRDGFASLIFQKSCSTWISRGTISAASSPLLSTYPVSSDPTPSSVLLCDS
jgi:hypothetical protein